MTEIVMVVVASAFALLGGILIGGLLEAHTKDGNERLERKLRKSQREVSDLREYIWLVTAGDPTTQPLTTEGALPESSVKVERSLHLNNGEGL